MTNTASTAITASTANQLISQSANQLAMLAFGQSSPQAAARDGGWCGQFKNVLTVGTLGMCQWEMSTARKHSPTLSSACRRTDQQERQQLESAVVPVRKSGNTFDDGRRYFRLGGFIFHFAQIRRSRFKRRLQSTT